MKFDLEKESAECTAWAEQNQPLKTQEERRDMAAYLVLCRVLDEAGVGADVKTFFVKAWVDGQHDAWWRGWYKGYASGSGQVAS